MKKLTLNALLISLALVLSFIEHFFPISLLIPVPGIKIGFANIVTIFALFYLNFPSAVIITALRCLLASILFGGMTSFLYSISGATLALITMALLKQGHDRKFSLIGISIGGAAAHNVGQITIAAFMLNSPAVFAYLPVLLITALITGFLTAIISMNLFLVFEKTKIVNHRL